MGYQVSGGGSTILLSATSDVPTFLLSSSVLVATLIWNTFSKFSYPVGSDPDSRFCWVTGQPSLSSRSWYWWNSLLFVCVSVLFPNLHCELFRAGPMFYLHTPPCLPASVLCVQDNFRISSRTGLGLWRLDVWVPPWAASVDF